MRSSALCGSDVEPGCLEERQRWTFGGEKGHASSSSVINLKHRRSCCHGGLLQPEQEGLRQLSSEEEQHVRWDPSLFVCLCVQVLDEKRKLAQSGALDQGLQISLALWYLRMCCLECVWTKCFRISEGERSERYREGLKGSAETLVLNLEPGLSLLD